MARKKYLWMDGTIHSKKDPNWDHEEAIRRGLIPAPSKEPSLAKFFGSSQITTKSRAQIFHEQDCAHAALTGGGSSND